MATSTIVGGDGLGLAAGDRLDASSSTLLPVAGAPVTLSRSLKVMPCLVRAFWKAVATSLSVPGQDAVEELDHGHFARPGGARPSRARGR